MIKTTPYGITKGSILRGLLETVLILQFGVQTGCSTLQTSKDPNSSEVSFTETDSGTATSTSDGVTQEKSSKEAPKVASKAAPISSTVKSTEETPAQTQAKAPTQPQAPNQTQAPSQPQEQIEVPAQTQEQTQAPAQTQAPTQPQAQAPIQPAAPIAESKRNENEETQKLLTNLAEKLEAVDSKLALLNDKVDITRQHIDQLAKEEAKAANEKVSVQPEIQTATIDDNIKGGTLVQAKTSDSDPEAGFLNDDAIQSYRKSLLLFNSQKYSEALLAFSRFVEQYPDHPLAGNAQFFVGDSYFRQGEFQLAIQEFERGINQYGESPKITETLSELVKAEEGAKKHTEATKYRQLLTSLFPHSPSAIPMSDLKLDVTNDRVPAGSTREKPAL